MSIGTRVLLAGGFLALLAFPRAALPQYLELVVTTSHGDGGCLLVGEPQGPWEPGYSWGDGWWQWQLPTPLVWSSDAGREPIFILESALVRYATDNSIALSFSLATGWPSCTVSIRSGLLTFPPLMCPIGEAHAELAVTSLSESVAVVSGLGPSGGVYLAQYNGLVPNGTTFHEAISTVYAGPGEPTDAAANSGIISMIGVVSNMSVGFMFTMSPHSRLDATSGFVVVPEPAGVLLLAAAAVMRRR